LFTIEKVGKENGKDWGNKANLECEANVNYHQKRANITEPSLNGVFYNIFNSFLSLPPHAMQLP
jgi:hypothetical protein